MSPKKHFIVGLCTDLTYSYCRLCFKGLLYYHTLPAEEGHHMISEGGRGLILGNQSRFDEMHERDNI